MNEPSASINSPPTLEGPDDEAETSSVEDQPVSREDSIANANAALAFLRQNSRRTDATRELVKLLRREIRQAYDAEGQPPEMPQFTKELFEEFDAAAELEQNRRKQRRASPLDLLALAAQGKGGRIEPAPGVVARQITGAASFLEKDLHPREGRSCDLDSCHCFLGVRGQLLIVENIMFPGRHAQRIIEVIQHHLMK